MHTTIEYAQEADSRWIAEIPELPAVMAYDATTDDAAIKAEILALRVMAERLEQGEVPPPRPL